MQALKLLFVVSLMVSTGCVGTGHAYEDDPPPQAIEKDQPPAVPAPVTQDAPEPPAPDAPAKEPDSDSEPASAPTAAQMESLYHLVWMRLANFYHPESELKDWAGWEDRYKGKLTTIAAMDQAIKEMVDSIGNRYTRYISPTDLMRGDDGLVDLGLTMRRQEDGSYAIDFLRWGSPAHGSDLRVGDTIKSIGGKTLTSLPFTEVEVLLRGKEGSKVMVVYDDNGKDVTLELTFAATPAPAIEASLLAGNIAYLRVPHWDSDIIVRAVVVALFGLIRQAEGKVNGLILDQRGNPGGSFTAAVQASSLFVEQGLVVSRIWRQGRLLRKEQIDVTPLPAYMVSPGSEGFADLCFRKPMVVLIDGSTASAAEIVSGALKDRGRAQLVGTNTFGKSVGYQTLELPNGGLLQISTQVQLTPSGFDVSQGGITPHRPVSQPRGKDDAQLKAGIAEVEAMIKAGK